MNFIKTFIITILFLIVIPNIANAQSNLLEINDMSTINVDSYTDAQILSLIKKAADLQIGEDEIYTIAKEKGLPDIEAMKLKNRIESLNPSKNKSEKRNDDVVEETIRTYDSSSSPMQENKRELSVFGSEYFQKNSMVFEPNLRIATPGSYILGPDDKINLNVFGVSEKRYTLRVNEEGDIYITNVGPIYVNGLTIEQATQKIKTKLASTIYHAISSGQTQINVSLSKIRSIRVTVIGQALKPGTYTVSSLTTLYNLLYLCGGPGPLGTYREIEIIRGNAVKRVSDIYAFLVNGNQKDNILLEEGDVVRIPYYKNMISVSGNVKREGKFELLENETFSKIIELCGGFTENAYKTAVSVNRITDSGKTIIDITKSQFDSFVANSGDEYFIRKNAEKYSNKISITGSVVRPGNYELITGMTLKDLIEKAGGLTGDAYTKTTSIFRYQYNRTPALLNVNLDSVLFHDKNIELNNDDSVSISSLFDFKESVFIKVEGNVRKQIKIIWRDGMTLQDAILMAGGLTESGDSNKIEVSSRVINANISQKNHLETESRLISLSNNIMLQPYDIIIVKAAAGYVSQRSVMILGDVKFPGKYILQKSGDKLADLLKRAEGFRASADSSSATIRRISKSNLSIKEREALFQRVLNLSNDRLSSNDNLRNEIYKSYELVSANLSKALSKPNSPENLILEDGDIINIEKNSNLVKISGEVYYPTIIPYSKKRSIKYYIRQAGNYMPSARKSGVLVIYPNGKAKSVKKIFCFKSYPKVTSRSEVFIPQKNKSNRMKISPSELAVIVSALGVVANVLISAKIL